LPIQLSAASNGKGLASKYAVVRFVRALALLLLLSLTQLFILVLSAPAQGASPFVRLAGRWLGEGRLGYVGAQDPPTSCRNRS